MDTPLHPPCIRIALRKAIQTLASLALGLLGTACLGSGPASPPASRPPTPAPWDGAVTILDAYLAERIQLLERRSPRFREGMEELREADVPIYIGTPEQIAAVLHRPWLASRTHAGSIGQFEVLARAEQRGWAGLVVRVDLAGMADIDRRSGLRVLSLPRSRRRLRERFDTGVDAVLVHEIWGHMLPVVQAGSMEGWCADPAPGQADQDACVMRREAEIRTELGLRPRERYAMSW